MSSWKVTPSSTAPSVPCAGSKDVSARAARTNGSSSVRTAALAGSYGSAETWRYAHGVRLLLDRARHRRRSNDRGRGALVLHQTAPSARA